MNIDIECAENVCILADRLKCSVKSLYTNNFTPEETITMQNLTKEIAYNINIEIFNMLNTKSADI